RLPAGAAARLGTARCVLGRRDLVLDAVDRQRTALPPRRLEDDARVAPRGQSPTVRLKPDTPGVHCGRPRAGQRRAATRGVAARATGACDCSSSTNAAT